MSRRLRILTDLQCVETLTTTVECEQIDALMVDSATTQESAEAQAYDEGEAAGRLAAQAEHEREIKQLRAAVAALAHAFEGAREELAKECTDAALRAGIEVARRILEREVAADPAMALRSAEAALQRLPAARAVEVRLNPDDHARLQDAGALTGAFSGSNVTFISDPTVGPGGSVIESDSGRVDARLEAQLNAARDLVLEGVGGGEPSR